MNRALLLLFLSAGLLATGCFRDADPLDWRIEGRHIGDLQVSLDQISTSLPAGLDREFAFCFNNVMADVRNGQSGSTQHQENRVCRRLRDKSVRDILIEGNQLARRRIMARFNEESGYLLRLIDQSDLYTEAQRQALPTRIEATQARIDRLRGALTRSNRRLAELHEPVVRS